MTATASALRAFRSFAFYFFMAGMAACSSSEEENESSTEPEKPPAATLSGSFEGLRSGAESARVLFDFTQSEDALKGSLQDSLHGEGAITGTVLSNRVEFVSIHDRGRFLIEWRGMAQGDGNLIRGRWVITLGGHGEGDWIAAR